VLNKKFKHIAILVPAFAKSFHTNRQKLNEKNTERTTSAWQNAGLSAKLNFSPFHPPKAVCFCFFIKFTKGSQLWLRFGLN
jgi:hypothetical protein